MHLEADILAPWNPASNLLLLLISIASFVIPFACCFLCGSICKMMIPEENTKNRLSDEAIDEDDESTAIVELYNIRKSIEIHHV